MVDVFKTLQVALKQRRIERVTLDRQIGVLARVLDSLGDTTTRRAGGSKQTAKPSSNKRLPMSAAVRKAVSWRMKQYCAARRMAKQVQ